MLVLDLSSDVCASDEAAQTIASHQTESDLSSESDSEAIQVVASHQTASDSSSLIETTREH